MANQPQYKIVSMEDLHEAEFSNYVLHITPDCHEVIHAKYGADYLKQYNPETWNSQEHRYLGK